LKQKEKATDHNSFNASVHGLRGVASLMVFFAHLLGGTAEHIYSDRLGYVKGVEPFWNFGTYGVYLFFAISGFVILPSVFRYSLGEFAIRRFIRIYPIFFVFTLLFVVLNAITNYIPSTNAPLPIFAGFTFLNLLVGTEQLSPNAWSLTYEVMFYALTAILVFFVVKTRSLVGSIIALALSLVFVISFPAAIFFLIGVTVQLMYQRGMVLAGNSKLGLELLAFILLTIIASMGHFAYNPSEMSNPIAQLTIVATALYFYFAVGQTSLTSKLLNNRWILYFGTVSYSLYLVHPYIYLPTRLLFDKAGWFSENILLSMVAFIVAVAVPTLLATHIVHVTLEKMPYKWFFKREVFSIKGKDG
jgi:peptidoglycan/LPS O-acetylase OafA/YrhL